MGFGKKIKGRSNQNGEKAFGHLHSQQVNSLFGFTNVGSFSRSKWRFARGSFTGCFARSCRDDQSAPFERARRFSAKDHAALISLLLSASRQKVSDECLKFRNNLLNTNNSLAQTASVPFITAGFRDDAVNLTLLLTARLRLRQSESLCTLNFLNLELFKPWTFLNFEFFESWTHLSPVSKINIPE